jgi:hypothetical protein
MKRGSATCLVTLLWILLLPGIVAAQSPQTPNTLKLDNPTARPKATLADIKLLVGHWKGEFLGATAEEVWLPAAGGSMLGTFRLYRGKEVLFYEIMIATEEEGSVSIKLKHFHRDLKGWEEKNETITFRFIQAHEHAVWFEGLTYRKLEDGSLQGFIAIRHTDGSVKEESFRYQPVRAW